MILQLPSDGQDQAYMREAQAWLDTNNLFHDSKNVARLAIAEFLANKNGHTLYGSRVGKEYNA